MAETKNGRIVVVTAEAKGMARVVTSGQVVATRAQQVAKLRRYIKDPRFNDETRAMYVAQLKDIQAEAK